ncbi:MAG: hypothetical protein KDD89_09380 [Anaerolineales bacterium]|nr:hypothetical protein [Anaerolineales bacterium]
MPSWEEFSLAPLADVQKIAPQTIILTNGGTRRHAFLAGIRDDDFISWSRQQMIRCLDLVFQHGVQHIFTTALAETNFDETTTGYRGKLVEWTRWALAGEEALADYDRLGWRVRLVGAERWPGLEDLDQYLRDATAGNEGATVWFTVASTAEDRWLELFSKLANQPITSRAEAIELLYGENVPLASLFIGSGKPQVFASIVPPLLIGNLQCYWRQHLGYDLDALTLRRILYDYAYLRRTWQADKSNRTEQAVFYRSAWENDPAVVGLGMRLGPFWYPAPLPARNIEHDD